MTRLERMLIAMGAGGCLALLAMLAVVLGYAAYHAAPTPPPAHTIVVFPVVWVVGGFATYFLRGTAIHRWLEERT